MCKYSNQKRRYCPVYVKGNKNERYMMEKGISECDEIKGKLDGSMHYFFFKGFYKSALV